MRRVLRIWPLYFATLAVGLILYPLVRATFGYTNDFAHHWPWYVLFLSNFDMLEAHRSGVADHTLMMLAVTWSVAVEEQFYLVWPWLLKLSQRLQPALFSSIVIGSAIFRHWHRDDTPALLFHTAAVVGDLAIGALMADLAFKRPVIVKNLVSFQGWKVALVYCTGILVLMYQEEVLGPAVGRLVQSVFFAFLVLEQSYGPETRPKISNIKCFSSAGRYTYGLYLLHPIALTALGIFLPRALPAWHEYSRAIVALLVGLPMSLGLAIISFHFFERPFLTAKARFSPVDAS